MLAQISTFAHMSLFEAGEALDRTALLHVVRGAYSRDTALRKGGSLCT